MNSTSSTVEGAGLVPGLPAFLDGYPDGTRRLLEARAFQPVSHAPIFKAFCRVGGPALDWLKHGTNTAIAIACVLAAPLIALMLLPLFLILLPVAFILGFIGIAAASINSDN
jgi:hypothetical protein